MSEHTPGPWEVRDGDPYDHVFTIAKPNKRICGVFGGLSCPEGAANARLIAAAPELLRALELVRDYGGKGETDDGESVSSCVENAIAKTKGS